MAKIYAFFNPLAGNGQCREDVTLLEFFHDNICYCDMTLPETYETRLFSLKPEDTLILCGGDGTVHRFVNLVQDVSIPCDILLFPLGQRNQFAGRLHHRLGDAPFSIKHQLLHCPSITVENRTRCFLWGVEFDPMGRRFHHRQTAVNVNGVCHKFRSLQLTANEDLTLQGRQAYARTPSSISCGSDVTVCFDRPVSVRIDGELIGQTERCHVCMAKR